MNTGCWSCLGLAPLLIALNAAAAQPQPPPYSAGYEETDRVRRVEYSDNLVIGVTGHADHPMMIEFDPAEPILDAAGGQIANWEIVKRGSRLFARPLDGARPTTLVVGTRTRSYVLDLTPGRRRAPASFVSKILVTYPPVEGSADARAARAAVDLRRGTSPLAESRQGLRNERYSVEVVTETIDIRPREVFDDGRFTYFQFPENLAVPAIYKSTPGTRDEWLVNSHRDGDFIVVHGIAPLWNLRAVGTVLGIFNDAFDPVGIAPTDATTVQGIRRELR